MTFTDIYGQHRRPRFQSVNDIELIDSPEALPPASGGVRQLEDGTAYLFTEFVTDPATLEAGDNSPLLGLWPSVSGYICTGGGPLLSSSGVPVFADRMFFDAPGGTLFDLTADDTTEHYFNKLTVTDPTGGALADVATLGTVDGFRVPTFQGCNFERFENGLTFLNSSEKIVFKFCVFRNVSAAGVTCATLDGSVSTEFLKVDGAYIKRVQSDTEVLRIASGGVPSQSVVYSNNDHDPTVSKSNILNGALTRESVGAIIRDSFPLANSKAFGSIQFGPGSHTVVGSGSAATEINPPTEEFVANERVTQVGDGVLQYDAIPDQSDQLIGDLTLTGVNSTVELSMAVNGTLLNQPPTRVTTGSTADEEDVTVRAVATLSQGDQVSMYGENIDGTGDFDVVSFTLTI